MSWEHGLLDLFDELETRAHGLALDAREADVADIARSEYAEVTLEARLHGAVGHVVDLETTGGTRLRARVDRVGRGCAAVTGLEATWGLQLVNLAHVVGVRLETAGAADESTLPVTSRLGLASAVRHLTTEVDVVAVLRSDGVRIVGEVLRVGADFVEVVAQDGGAGTVLVPLAGLVMMSPA